MRDLVNATVGFEGLAIELDNPSKSLHRMLSARGNSTMENPAMIFRVFKDKLNIDIRVHIVSTH